MAGRLSSEEAERNSDSPHAGFRPGCCTLFFLAIAALICSSCATTSRFRFGGKGIDNDMISSSRLASEIDGVLDDTLLSGSLIGIKIVSAHDGAVLYQRNNDKLFHPASNMKLLTTATALRRLGPEYVFKTVVSADTSTDQGCLDGNLYLEGCGDPLVKTSDLDSIATALAAAGITTINGDIIGNVSAFDDLSWGSGWMWDDEPSTDAAFISPLTVNSNSIDFFLDPGRYPGDTVEFSMEPGNDVVTVVNRGITSEDTTLPEVTVDRVKRENTVYLKGRIAPGSSPQKFSISVWKPEAYFLNLLKRQLTVHGISVTGALRLDTTRGRLVLATVVHSLDSVLHQINKPSHNLAAENLLKALAKELRGAPGSAQAGISIIKAYLFEAGVDTTKLILADGSGLSWYNVVTPDAVIQLLLDQYRHKDTFDHFYSSLPIAGIDGTLKNRMKGSRVEGNVHAKTGSLKGVSTLSGYANSANAGILIFSIMCNHFPGEITSLRQAQDRIMELLAHTIIDLP